MVHRMDPQRPNLCNQAVVPSHPLPMDVPGWPHSTSENCLWLHSWFLLPTRDFCLDDGQKMPRLTHVLAVALSVCHVKTAEYKIKGFSPYVVQDTSSYFHFRAVPWFSRNNIVMETHVRSGYDEAWPASILYCRGTKRMTSQSR